MKSSLVATIERDTIPKTKTNAPPKGPDKKGPRAPTITKEKK